MLIMRFYLQETLPEYLEAMDYRTLQSPFYEPFNESLDYIGLSINRMYEWKEETEFLVKSINSLTSDIRNDNVLLHLS